MFAMLMLTFDVKYERQNVLPKLSCIADATTRRFQVDFFLSSHDHSGTKIPEINKTYKEVPSISFETHKIETKNYKKNKIKINSIEFIFIFKLEIRRNNDEIRS